MGLGGNCGSSLRICGRTGEIARIALFLAAPESGYISGATLVVDWGSVVAGAYMVENIAAARLAKYKNRCGPGSYLLLSAQAVVIIGAVRLAHTLRLMVH